MRFESPMTKFSNVSVEVTELFGADEAVPVVAVKELEPCHVGLNNGGTAELTRFEQDGADGLAGGALTLKDAGDDALWTVEAQAHVGIA